MKKKRMSNWKAKLLSLCAPHSSTMLIRSSLPNVLHAILLTLILGTLSAKAQKVFYIYRNDGCINSFLTAEIDSMMYSQIDLDSIMHDEIVVHEVYTADSIYRIPLELIDSVSFITPETVYQPGVKVIEGEMRSHILSRDGLTLVFDAVTPQNVLPVVGDKLVSTTGDEFLESAFVGQVSKIVNTSNGIEIICEPVDLTDVFDTYYSYSSTTAYSTAREAQSRSAPGLPQIEVPDGYYSGNRILRPGPFSDELINTDLSYHPNDNFAFGISQAEEFLSFAPVFDCHACIIISRTHGVYIEVRIIGDYTFEERLALAGHIGWSKDISFFDLLHIKQPTFPIPEALVDITFDAGISINAQADLCIEQQWRQQYKHSFLWNWSSKGNAPLKNTHKIDLKSKEHTGKVAIDGSVGIGFYVKPGISFIATSQLDIAEVGLKAEVGVKLEGEYVPYVENFEFAKTSTDLYNQIKDQEVAVYGYRSLTSEATIFKWSVSHEIPNNWLPIPFNLPKDPWLCLRAVPLFSDTKLEKEGGMYFASTKASGNVETTDVGFALIDQDENAYYMYSKRYSGPNDEINDVFLDKPSSTYTLYPLVKYMDMELIAEPTDKVEDIINVQTLTFNNIGKTSAYLEGVVNNFIPDCDNGEVGFMFNTTGNPSNYNAQSVKIGNLSDFYDTPTFSTTLNNLEEETTYYVRAYYFNGRKYYLGNVLSIKTEKNEDDETGDETPEDVSDNMDELIDRMNQIDYNLSVNLLEVDTKLHTLEALFLEKYYLSKENVEKNLYDNLRMSCIAKREQAVSLEVKLDKLLLSIAEEEEYDVAYRRYEGEFLKLKKQILDFLEDIEKWLYNVSEYL